MYNWEGTQFPDEIAQGATNAGLAQALANMSAVSGARWNGFADWASRGVAGLYGGRNDYMTQAVARKMEQDRLQMTREQHEATRKWQNAQMQEIEARRKDIEDTEKAARFFYDEKVKSQDPIDMETMRITGPPQAYSKVSDWQNAYRQNRVNVHNGMMKKDAHQSAITILSDAGIPPTGDPDEDIETAKYINKRRVDVRFPSAGEEETARRNRELQRNQDRDDARAAYTAYVTALNYWEDNQRERVKLIEDLTQKLYDGSEVPGTTGKHSMTMAQARRAATARVDEMLPALKKPAKPVGYRENWEIGGQSGNDDGASNWMLPFGHLDLTLGSALSSASPPAPRSEPAIPTNGPPPVSRSTVNPAISTIKVGAIIPRLIQAGRTGRLSTNFALEYQKGLQTPGKPNVASEFNKMLAEVKRQNPGMPDDQVIDRVISDLSVLYSGQLNQPYEPPSAGWMGLNKR